jgi:hypothetical protein
MMQIDQPTILRPLERHPQLETDHFCEQCGYNLHGQPVSRDPRTQIVICRCPECGRFAAAGKDGTAGSLWLSRFAATVLVAWCLIAINVLGWGGFFLGIWPYVYLSSMTSTIQATPLGQRVEWMQNPRPLAAGQPQGGYVIAGTDQPAREVVRLRVPWFDSREWPDEYRKQRQREMMWMTGILIALAAGTALLMGNFIAVAMWHVRRARALWGLVLPILACIIMGMMWMTEEDIRLIRGWSIARISIFCGIELVALIAGLWLGRPLARAFARMFIPPRPRQFLAFLWHADGKTLPGTTSATINDH